MAQKKVPFRVIAQSKSLTFIKNGGYSARSDLYFKTKRIFDVMFSACLLTVGWPIFICIGILIRLDSKGAVIYKHKRIGYNGKEILVYKFRSMKDNADSLIGGFTPEQMVEWQTNFKVTDDPRVTKFGKWIRKASMDELPQLINILKGDLSMVGPRPITYEELEKYRDSKTLLLSVRPGLTGYWQVNARSDCSYEQRIAMELEYVQHACWSLDVKIILSTIQTIISGRGAK